MIASLLENRKIKIGLIAVVSCLIAYIGMLTWINKVHRVESNITQFWTLLERVCSERLALLPKYAAFIHANDPQAQPLADNLMKVYQDTKAVTFSEKVLNDPNGLQALANQQQIVATILHQAKAQIASRGINTQEYQLLNQALDEREVQIRFVIPAISMQIIYYNRLIYDKPQRWFNNVFTRFPPKYFPQVATLEGIEAPKR